MLHESNKFKYDQIIINKLGTTFNKSLITNYFIDSSVGLLIIKDMINSEKYSLRNILNQDDNSNKIKSENLALNNQKSKLSSF